eukprot:TRINITY_DN62458_c0_g1_i1.p1 TRINITY_DN62458_c0_g1~~TRINITY_DN62458_c0_g1_i1.p1  ORF type:complete len:312 (-),score=44.20 TRINITY_DN62458_c0_g1_i1:204-1139(-)
MTVAPCSMYPEETFCRSQFRRRPWQPSQKADTLRCLPAKTCPSTVRAQVQTQRCLLPEPKVCNVACHADEASPSKRRRQGQQNPEGLLAFKQPSTVAVAACFGPEHFGEDATWHDANKKRVRRLCFGQVEVFEVSKWMVKPEEMPGRIVECDNCGGFFPRRRSKNEVQHAGEKLIHRLTKLVWICSDCLSPARPEGFTCQNSASKLQLEQPRQSSETRSAAQLPPPQPGPRPTFPLPSQQAWQQQVGFEKKNDSTSYRSDTKNRPAKNIDTVKKTQVVRVLKSVSGRLYVMKGSSKVSRNSSDSWVTNSYS